MSAPCKSPVSEAALTEYALGGGDADEVELHVVGCGVCAARLEKTLVVVRGLRELAASTVRPVLSREELAQKRSAGVAISETELVGAEVSWRTDGSQLYVAVLRADLTDLARIDVHYCAPDGSLQAIYPDAPFRADAAELLLCCDEHVASAHEALRFRVVGISRDSQRRVLADCTVRAAR